MATIDAFRQGFKGVRGNRFKITGSFPVGGIVTDMEFYAKAASVPGSGIGIIPVGYKGRPIKFSGERTYQDWIVQIYDSSTVDLRQKFEDWIESMDNRNAHEVNYNIVQNSWMVEYQDMSGTQSNSTHQKKIKLRNCFPIDLSPIDLSYDTPDTFAEFTATLTYDFWEYS